jgi:rfaE bifunctional protein nucleotidyltransferase chain/domain
MPVLLKEISLEEAAEVSAQMREADKRLVMTNGCFDLLHPGHVVHLQQARDLGEALLIGLNSDASVRELKGPDRPVYPAEERAILLSALECVDYVVVFEELDAGALQRKVRPGVYVKGGDYTIDTINQTERKILEECGAEIHILPQVKDFSTTNLIRRVRKEV